LENRNLWAPWRINYIQGLAKPENCFLCEYLNKPDDENNLVLWRTEKSVVVLNKFPYNNGHLLIAPTRHMGELENADESEMLELIKLVQQAKKLLSLSLNPHGFNVGMNFGRCAGAGLPEHLHIHIVPRWSGDTNFMSTCSETKVISQSLSELYNLLKDNSRKHNLPCL